MVKAKRPKPRVGYKNPPIHTRFKPGQSGNPAGRPKGKPLTFSDAFETELARLIQVTEGDKVKMLTKLQAIAKRHINKALSGDTKATILIINALTSKKIEANENLSPILDALRGIHAKHEATQPKSDQARGKPGLASSAPGHGDGNSDEA
jgi:hypothetical protein